MEYWDRLHGRLMTRAMDLLDGDYDDAKEAMQDAALEIWRKWEHLTLEQRNDGFFVKAVHFRATDRWRRSKRYTELTEDVEEDLHRLGRLETPDVPIAWEGLDPFDIVDAAVPKMARRVREVWLLSHEDQMTNAEIAGMLGIDEVTVRRHMQRARDVLAAALRSAGIDPHKDTLKAIPPGQKKERADD